MRKNLRIFLYIFPFFFILIFLTTFGLLNAYFEQDEWMGFADVINSYNLPWWDNFIPAQIHFSPLGAFFWSSLYKAFHLQAHHFYLTQLAVHASVSSLVFILTLHLTNNKTTALISGLLFLLNGRAHQAFTHLAIFHSTDAAMFFILLFFVYLSSIKDKILTFKNSILLFLIFLASVFIREEGLIIIPIFVSYLFCIDRQKINKKNMKFFLLLLAGVVAFLCGRYFLQTLYTEPIPTQYQITGRSAEYNLVTIPIKFIVQNLIYSERIAVFFVENYQKIYPGMIKNIYLDAAPLMDAAFFYIFSFIACIFGVWVLVVRPKQVGRLLLFLSVWILSNAFILSLVGRPLFVLEPRYLYFSAFPVFCFVAIFLYTTYSSKSKYFLFNLAKKILVVIILIIIGLTSFQEIRSAVNNQVKLGTAKKKVLKSLREVHPSLSKNTIFYITCSLPCSRNSELGISPENVLPFSSGPGMIILVTYSIGQEKEWGPFFTKHFLFHTFSEDYKKIGDRSFGYFVTKSKLRDVLKKHKISKNIVVALEYNEKSYTFRDISKDFRKTLP